MLSQSQKKLVEWIDEWVYLIGYLIGPLLVALEHVLQSNGVTSGFSTELAAHAGKLLNGLNFTP